MALGKPNPHAAAFPMRSLMHTPSACAAKFRWACVGWALRCLNCRRWGEGMLLLGALLATISGCECQW
jgi:hypothetical protein